MHIYGGDKVDFPTWPNLFSKFDAQTYAMGDCFLFSADVAAIYLNPARMGDRRHFLIEEGYEWRSTIGFCGENVLNTPHLIGVTYPYRNLSFGIAYATLCNLRQRAGLRPGIDLFDTSILRGLFLGVRYKLSNKFYSGVSAILISGDAHFPRACEIGFERRDNGKGFGVMVGVLFRCNPKFILAMKIQSPLFIKGTSNRIDIGLYPQGIEYHYSYPIESRYFYPCNISLGVSTNLSDVLQFALQVDYIGWRDGYWEWGKDEWDIHLGMERKIGTFLSIRGGFCSCFFPDPEKSEEATKWFLTGGCGINVPFGKANIGTGLGEELWPLSWRKILLADIRINF
ncbi:MAG: hypothetical protein U9R01_06080 [candidate division WOR-3 bacterium]|nr:hypothetical protein [candidate division WOR-3 bacterium]